MSKTFFPHALRCEYKTDPVGIDTVSPRLFWKIEAEGRQNVHQTAYQILVEDGRLWDSGKVISSQTVHIPYAGTPLLSGQRASWKVRVWEEDGKPSDWSEPAFWQMGLLSPEDWQARWISLPAPRPHLDLLPVSYLRCSFDVGKPVSRATLYATARGVYIPHLNGQKIADTFFAPGWTDYNKRIAYQAYDVTSFVQSGRNMLAASLGDGWYVGYIGFWNLNERTHYGKHPQFLAQLVLEYADGSTETMGTDDTWRGTNGPILFSDMLMGEKYDARLEMPGWDTPEFEDASWRSVKVESEHDLQILRVAQKDLPVRITGELAPKTITRPLPGTYLFDLGQNMVGWARLKVQGQAGTVVQMQFGEMLNPDGTLYVANLRGAKATDFYILKGDGVETYEPHFTFHGFRYVEMTGYPGEPSQESITGVVLHSDIPQIGTFECSEPLVNQLVSNIDWGQRGNFLSVPTDCPQRDERLGWLGDGQVFARTAAGNRDVAAFYTKWMEDVVDAQSPEGAFSDIAPRLVNLSDGAPAWADAGVIVPWTVYQVYGDTRILETHYAAMAKWIKYLDDANPDHLWMHKRSNDFGDWLSVAADTDKDLLATAYFAYDTFLMSKIAAALGKDEDAARYTALFEGIKAAFNAAFVSDDVHLKSGTQTAYVLALHFNLLPNDQRTRAAEHLVEEIEKREWHLSTGFVGVGYLCPVLAEAGYADVAYRLLLNTTYPSWGYSIEQGATTIWERWDGWTQEKGFQDADMNSFNHYSLGSVGEWLQRYAGGIDTDPYRAGYAHLLLRPYPSRRVSSVKASLETLHGRASSMWHVDGDTFHWTVTVPSNTTATATLPDGTAHTLGSGTYEFSTPIDL